MKAVFDSNIVIDYLNGIPQAAQELAHYREAWISPITWLEAQVKAPPGLEDATRAAIDTTFRRLDLDTETLQRALDIRRSLRVKLPDALILASARTRGWTLVTRNTKDFPAELPGVRIPYQL
jgi:predicted nucleic acid-binding protein